jgi:hypothetical protein
MSKQIQYKADAVCDACGRFGAFDFCDEHLCSDCYSERGSCCLEFGGYDLWKDEKKSAKPEKKQKLKHK